VIRVALLAVVAAALAVTAAGAAPAVTFPRGTATIDTGTRKVVFDVEIAATDAQRSLGLMHRRRLAPTAGMAFLYPAPARGSFWMKNTLIPLSIAFWDRRGRIVRILDMTPCPTGACRVYSPGVPFAGALEVNRGAFRRLGVRRGDVVVIQRR
jgi:uncharacterized membrane protein (UPF0127 family)